MDRINRVDEAITLATLPNFKPVVEGEMVATVKIVPFGMPARLRDEAVGPVPRNALRVAPYRIRKVGVVSTLLPGLAKKVVEKTLQVTAERLAPAGAKIIAEKRIAHDEKELTAAIGELFKQGAELVIVFGASAIADRRDVIPAAIERAGGKVEHFGMPVDPGNLMLIGQVNGAPVLGAPGCARSPKENGFDWILMRLLAGLPVTRDGHHRARRRRAADGDRHAAAAARRRRRRRQSQRRGGHSCGRALEPHGRAEQAAGDCCTASRWCGSSPSRRSPRAQNR